MRHAHTATLGETLRATTEMLQSDRASGAVFLWTTPSLAGRFLIPISLPATRQQAYLESLVNTALGNRTTPETPRGERVLGSVLHGRHQ